ncbi:AsmA family protein [Desulfovibrio mangrovi]|uniref:AsmA family protein n=1 Tax=Desulfovibrio mangrovi TaxID=2976983 RepID=UPI002246B3A0|nr:AsmA family protein [Desulfovibrio mangrovi]UZP68563.1 AsmA family protein [Desulfovibrio mangrovi]
MRSIARILIILVLFSLLGAGGAALLLSRLLDTEALRARIETRVSSLTGGECSVEGGITLSFYPWLALALDDVVLKEPEQGTEVIRVDKLYAALRLKPLLSRSLEFAEITLANPVVTLRTSQNGTVPWRTMLSTVSPVEGQAGVSEPDSGYALNAVSVTGVNIENGLFEWIDESAVSGNGTAPFVRVSRLELEADVNGRGIWEGNGVLESSVASLNLAFLTNGAVDFVAGTMKPDIVQSFLSARGSVAVEGRSLPLSLATRAKYAPAVQNAEFSLQDVNIDGLELDGDLRLANCTSPGWQLSGKASVRKLSLPYWFAFGELLPTSLQHALDSLEGTLSLRMDRKGLQVDSLDVSILGMPFHGKGAVADFSRPEIFIDVAGPFIDVNKVFPEIMEKPPAKFPKPARPGKAVFSADMDPDDNPEDDMGYDIRVRADKAVARSFEMGGLSFRCWPMPATGTYTSYTVDSFYGGSVDSLLSIRDTMGLDISVSNVRTREVSRLITGEPILGGRLSGKASVKSGAHTIWGMVAGLEGKAEATLNDGYIQTVAKRDGTKPKHELEACSIRLSGKSQHPNPDNAERYLPYSWNLQLGFVPPRAQERYDVRLNGPVIIDSRRALPVKVNGAVSELRWRGKVPTFGQAVSQDISLTGTLDFDLERETLKLADGRLKTPYLTGACSLSGGSLLGSPVWDGSVATDEIDLRKTIAAFNGTLWNTADLRALSYAAVRSRFHVESGNTSLQDMTIGLDSSKITGGVAFTHGKPFVARYSFKADSVDLDRYLPPSENGKKRAATPWKLDWINDLDLAGEIAVGRLTYKNLDFSSVAARTKIGNGVVTLAPFSSGFYKGTLEGEFTGRVAEEPVAGTTIQRKALNSHFALRLKGVDLEHPAMRLAGDDYLGGTTSATLDVTGMLTSNDDIPARLNGFWGFDIVDGYYSLSKSTNGTRQRSSFSKASASGSMEQGVLRNNNLKLDSLLVSMQGAGDVDLARKSVDYRVSVTYAEIPTFPVRIYGPLNDPKTSIRGAEILPQTIGKIGGGVFNLFKRVITTPFKALEMLGRLAGNGTVSK